ncbi:hypothetical protein LS684_11230 [Cytobacillus spongiae]|nr:hypothetical protein [Cytobacillus spongiae]UII57914.1 hypothetical protein LS684_11230 [Cytobacillus spongiae]
MIKVSYYQQCFKGVGKYATIRTNDGGVHRGVIHRVTPSKVYIRPLGGQRRNYGGFGYGYGYGYGYRGFGPGYGIALGAIIGLAVGAAFFW